MSKDFLTDIIQHKRRLVEEKKASFGERKQNVPGLPSNRYNVFKKEISKPGRINLIAEIKKASPSRGLIRSDFQALELARLYEQNGADAISVLTEEKYFLGKMSYVRDVSDHGRLPVLLKDFILDPVQVREAFYYRASAVLLIVGILGDPQLAQLMKAAHEYDMDCLVEVHNELELERALKAGAQIIGVNNRDLKSFDVDLTVGERLIPMIPRGRVIVTESGIRTHEDVLRFQQLGAHAVLIGETFMRADDISRKMNEVMRGERA